MEKRPRAAARRVIRILHMTCNRISKSPEWRLRIAIVVCESWRRLPTCRSQESAACTYIQDLGFDHLTTPGRTI